MSGEFDAASLERRYEFLADCPPALFAHVVTLPDGRLKDRVAGVLQWRDALLEGRLPPPGPWPSEAAAGPVRQALTDLGLVRFCKEQPELVDELLMDLLDGIAGQIERLRAEVSERLRELESLERERLSAEEEARARRKNRDARTVTIDAGALLRLREQAATEVTARARPADERVLARWSERARIWAEIADVFGDLGQLMGRGWDLSQGVLRSVGWRDLLRLRELLERLPQLREIIRQLGRLRSSTEELSASETIFVPVRRLEEERLEVLTPLVPAETRGVERSGELARMLPGEAVMLGHPKLRLVWHARRAERALLTYRVEGVVSERTWVERDSLKESTETRPRPERGPILAVIDTSGSMHGLPEQIAKALVLEALRTAHAEKRRCLLYSYSGPGQVLEHELDLSPEGVGRLLKFLAMSFGGGNDEAGVVSRVVTRLKQAAWKKADVIFVSDGEWPAPGALVSEVAIARAEGHRFHGVQIGNRGRTGLHSICDPVHIFRDWDALGGHP